MSARSTTIPIAEIFGPVIQGEGPLAGTATVFIRTGGCDSRCSWCDSLYAVLPEYKHEWEKLSPDEIVVRVQQLTDRPCWITLSGGNPAIHASLGATTRKLKRYGYEIAVETQGTIVPEWIGDVDVTVVSPKPPSSGEPWDECRREAVRQLLWCGTPGTASCLKIVIADEADLTWALDVWAGAGRPDLYLQPCNPRGREGEALAPAEMATQYRALSELVLRLPPETRDHIRVLPQLHVLAYGAERGR